MKVPYVDLVAQNEPLREETLAAVERVLSHGQFVLGPEVRAFEDKMQKFTNAGHIVSCSSGTSALTLAMRALDIGNGDEVITVSHSFVATATAIRLVGAEPRFVDVDVSTGLIDPSKFEAAKTRKTKAVLVVHLGGVPCEMDSITTFCDHHNLQLIEDCAQAIGATYDGRHAGTFGIGCFSLHPLKTLSAYGDAGFIATGSAELAERLRTLRNIGLVSRDELAEVGENARLDTLHAAMLLPKVKRLPSYVAARNEHAAEYRARLSTPVQHFALPKKAKPAYSCYAVRVPNRDRTIAALREHGIDAKIHYPKPIHTQAPFHEFSLQTNLPITVQLASEILSLPVTPEITNEQRQFVIDALNRILRSES